MTKRTLMPLSARRNVQVSSSSFAGGVASSGLWAEFELDDPAVKGDLASQLIWRLRAPLVATATSFNMPDPLIGTRTSPDP